MKIKSKLLVLIFTVIFIIVAADLNSKLFYLNKKAQMSNTTFSENNKLIASLPEHSIKLYAINSQHGGVYKGLMLYIDGKSAIFDWESDSNPTFQPKLHIEEVHVINSDNFSEIKVANPLDILKNTVQITITKQNNNVFIKITLNKKTKIIKIKNSDVGFWFENVYFGNLTHYDIKNNLLTVRAGAQVSPSGFVGEVVITYKFSDNKYVLKDTTFEYSKGL
ncbi:hypothetical protein [Clostridium sp.]|uniref:hypothetical protein n=1 Tax=Clostridium sp. TaxID=1506 RepID=UPI001A3A4FAB|nr:hypothetical protein [Clostridium sp.]MBK5240171.1 hypothetical protein [Clostridium sp.]